MFGFTTIQLQAIGKNSYFRKRPVGEVKDNREEVVADRDLIDRIRGLDEGEFLRIPHTVKLIPDNHQTSRHFLKHAKEIWLPWKNRQEMRDLRPIDLIREAFDSADGGYHVGIAFRSHLNGVITRIPFVAMLGGDKLFTYAAQSPFTGIDITSYCDTEAVQGHGGKYHATVPSRRQNVARHPVTLEGVPIDGCRYNHLRWTNVMTTHACPTKLWDLSYRHNQKNEWCEHEVAAYRQVTHKIAEEGDTSALDYSPILQPTQGTVDFNGKLEQQVIVEYENQAGKVKERLPNRAEREMFLYNLTKRNLGSSWTEITPEQRQYVTLPLHERS